MPIGKNDSEILHTCAHPWLQAPDIVRCDAAVFVAAEEDMAAGLELTIDYEGSCRIQVLPHSIHLHSAGWVLINMLMNSRIYTAHHWGVCRDIRMVSQQTT